MTNPSAAPDAVPALDAPATPLARRDRSIALVSTLLLLISMPVAYLPGDGGDVAGMFAMIVVTLAVMAALLLWLVPRERLVPERAARSALIMGIVSIIVGVVFWTGLPFGVGTAAIALGLSQRESAPASQGRGMATAGVVLGGIAVLASFVLLLVG